MERTRDGFEVAEEDLKLRGAGDFLGQAQSGDSPFIFADLAVDLKLLLKAREIAMEQDGKI
jgi:ATP-dependent DNA helicase RecG